MPYDQGPHLQALSHFTLSVLLSGDVGAMLHDLVNCLDDALRVTGGAATLAERGRFTAGVPPYVVQLEQAQYEHHEGPCISAHQTGDIVTVSDLRQQAHRWPHYCAIADNIGEAAVAGIPLQWGTQSLGALNLYLDQPHQWTQDDLAAVSVMADLATSHLINAARIQRQQRLSEQLERALDSRLVIEQAKGIIANSHRISVDDAFERIRRYARSHHASIHMVAEAIVRVGLRPP